MTKALDFDADDFAQEPWRYPGAPPPHSGLVHGRSYRRLTPKQGRRLGQACVRTEVLDETESLSRALLLANVARVDQRHVVVAVGSNASPIVMRRKFARADVNTTVPFVCGSVAGLRIAHSAHVSDPGYVAATPSLDESETATVVVSLLDDQQIACLDSTEPNYVRRTVTADVCTLTLEGGEQPRRFQVYASKWGVLAEPEKGPLAFRPQQGDLFEWLVERLPVFAAEFSNLSTREVMSALASDAALRGRAKDLFRSAEWVTSSGLDQCQPGGVDHYESIPSEWVDHGDRSDSLVCTPTLNALERRGEQCVTVHPDVAAAMGSPQHVGVRAVEAPQLPWAPARLTTDSTVGLTCAAVDQVLRNAMGVELQEHVELSPIGVRTSPWADRLLSRTPYAMVRVQAADLASVEQEIALLSPLSLDVLGLQSGDSAVIQGAPDSTGRVADVRLPVHRAPEDVVDRREQLSGGSLSARFPSASDALGTFPDLPWVFLDSAARSHLGVGSSKLAIVRIRASRRFQLTREFRELLLLLAIAFLGLATLVDNAVEVLLLMAGIVITSGLVVRARLRHRLATETKIRRGPSILGGSDRRGYLGGRQRH